MCDLMKALCRGWLLLLIVSVGCGRETRVLCRIPGIGERSLVNEDAARFYVKIVQKLGPGKIPDNVPRSLLQRCMADFVRGTERAFCTFHPKLFPHVTRPADSLPYLPVVLRFSRSCVRYANELAERGGTAKAADILERVVILGWQIESEAEITVSVLGGRKIRHEAYVALHDLYRSRRSLDRAQTYSRLADQLKEENLRVYLPVNRTLHEGSFEEVRAILECGQTLFRKDAIMVAAGRALDGSLDRTTVLKALSERGRIEADPVVRDMAESYLEWISQR